MNQNKEIKEVDIDVDYENFKITPQVSSPPLFNIIDYSNNFNNFSSSDETEDLKNQLDSIRAALFGLQSFPNSVINTMKPDSLDIPKIVNVGWKEYNSDATDSGIPVILVNNEKAINLIYKREREGYKIYISQSRRVRNSEGHMTDPWNRSMYIYKPKFPSKIAIRENVKVELNSCEELLTWEIFTTIKGKKVSLLTWEKVKMGYLRRETIDKFLDQLNPNEIKLDKAYET